MKTSTKVTLLIAGLAACFFLYPENQKVDYSNCDEVVTAETFAAWSAAHGSVTYRPEEGVWLDYRGAEIGYSASSGDNICA